MNELRNLARSGPIADFIDQRFPWLFEKHVSGVSLRIDPLWLSWYLRFGVCTPPPRWPEPCAASASQRDLRLHYGMEYEFGRRPPSWSKHCKSMRWPEDAHPVSIIVILRDRVIKVPEDWPRIFDVHPIVYEYREEAVLQACAPGDTVIGATSGTIGGYLWNPMDGSHYLVSCAHVLGTMAGPPGPAVQSRRSVVGNVVESHGPPIATGKCNSRLHLGTAPNSVDVAVADLSRGPTISLSAPGVGKIVSRTTVAAIGQSDPVTLTGAVSGTVTGEVHECNVWKELTFRGRTYCFADLFVVKDATHHYLPSTFTQQGDSGAWVVNTSAGHASWDGMLVGGDGTHAYCSYAENIASVLDPKLALPP